MWKQGDMGFRVKGFRALGLKKKTNASVESEESLPLIPIHLKCVCKKQKSQPQKQNKANQQKTNTQKTKATKRNTIRYGCQKAPI